MKHRVAAAPPEFQKNNCYPSGEAPCDQLQENRMKCAALPVQNKIEKENNGQTSKDIKQ